jgi:hypothetical protein
MPGSILNNNYGSQLILTDRHCQSLPELCLDNDNVTSSTRIVYVGNESMPSLLNQDRRGNLTTLMNLCRVPNKGTMTSPSSLDLYCISSLNHNAPMNNDSTEHSLKCDDQELGSSKPLSGAYFSPLVWIILVAVLARSTCLKAFIDRYRRIALRSSCRFNPMTLRKQMRVGTRCKVNIPVPVVEFV